MSDTTKDAVPVAWFYYEDGEFIRMYDSEDRAEAAREKFGGDVEPVYKHPAQVQAEAVQVDSIARLIAFHAEQLEANPYCYFELAYTRQTDWMAWITDRPAQGEPGTAAYAKSRKVIVRGQGATAEEACADALAALAAPSTGDQS